MARGRCAAPCARLLSPQENALKLIPQALLPLALAMLAWPVDATYPLGLLLIGLLALGLSTPNALDHA